MAIKDETCFVIGNGESRNIFGSLERLKHKGTRYGCNAIYRDWPNLCDKIFAVNQPMYDEIIESRKSTPFSAELVGPEDISEWNYMVDGDPTKPMPEGLRIYRTWVGGDAKRNTWRTLDLAKARGSGVSAVLDAAEKGYKHIFMIAFDILGAQQWSQKDGMPSRKQNNIYKNTSNYPERMNMKAYLKYEWMYQLTQITRQFPKSNFYLINRKEYIKGNALLPHYIKYSRKNFYGSHYAELQKFIEKPRDPRSFFVWSIQPN